MKEENEGCDAVQLIDVDLDDHIAELKSLIDTTCSGAIEFCRNLTPQYSDHILEFIHELLKTELQALIDALATGPWRPIESAPKDGRRILVRLADGERHVCYWSRLRNDWVFNGSHLVVQSGPIMWAELK